MRDEHAPPPLSTLTEEEGALALARYRLIQPCLEQGVPLAQVAKHHGLVRRTVQRWVARYQAHGLAGLTRRVRADRGQSRHLRPELKDVIEGLALRKPAPTAAFVHRQVVDIATQHGWPIPSYLCVYKVIKQLDPGLVTLAHAGSKAYRTTFDLLYRREAEGPNDIWQADHTLVDLWVQHDDGHPVRPWLTVIIDDYSRAIAGFGVSFHAPSAIQTALVLRQAIWRKPLPQWPVCGIPMTFYTDHGSDFTSHHLEQVSADLKMGLVFSEVGMPRGRGRIERFFRTINQMLLCSLPGYTPAGAPTGKTLLTLSAFEAHLQHFLLAQYHQRPHSETGVPPQARWAAGGFLPRLPESLEQLDLLLLTVAKSRKVRQDGIHFQGFCYLDTTLAAYVGEHVTIRYDPRDMAEIRVFHNHRFLCRAICAELAGETIALREIIQARTHRRKALRQTLQDRTRTVDALLEAHRGYHQADEAPMTNESASRLEKDMAHEDAPTLKRYFNE
jgi:putative transposase